LNDLFLPEFSELKIFKRSLKENHLVSNFKEHQKILNKPMQSIITGIQQVGIGVTNANEAWAWYSKYFGVDAVIFNDAAPAPLMTKYTGGEVHKRYAILAMNMQGGGGFEIWEYTSRKAQPASFEVNLGDTGIQVVKIRSKNVEATYNWYRDEKLNLISGVVTGPDKKQTFYLRDPYGNLFQVVENEYWFMETGHLTGGIAGVVIAVSNLERSMNFYSNILKAKDIAYDVQGIFPEWKNIPGGEQSFRRIMLKQDAKREGPFSRLVGPCSVELIKAIDYSPRKIFGNRYWGDQGYIHLCFDVAGMKYLEQECAALGYPFVINSATGFEMGEATGHFTYNEDPDGTLIEYVEAQRVPILKKLGWYFNLKNRDMRKPLPNWMVKALRFNRRKKI
jgi:catechol 2,3-dioxygenase-like lactoylglutathione lyase family enzyme